MRWWKELPCIQTAVSISDRAMCAAVGVQALCEGLVLSGFSTAPSKWPLSRHLTNSTCQATAIHHYYNVKVFHHPVAILLWQVFLYQLNNSCVVSRDVIMQIFNVLHWMTLGSWTCLTTLFQLQWLWSRMRWKHGRVVNLYKCLYVIWFWETSRGSKFKVVRFYRLITYVQRDPATCVCGTCFATRRWTRLAELACSLRRIQTRGQLSTITANN
jgi:hypothetical protein